MMENPKTKIGRPRQIYTGPPSASTSPIDAAQLTGRSRVDLDADRVREAALRDEVRAWLREHLPWEYGKGLPPRFDDLADEVAFGREWQAKLAERSLGRRGWPEEYGGRGAGAGRALHRHRGARPGPRPELVGRIGINLVGPTLLAHGTPEQKAALAAADPRRPRSCGASCSASRARAATSPRVATQGRRAPTAAGSLNGQKVWTSYAQFADWGLCLARTDPDAPKQQGHLRTSSSTCARPGVEVRPLRQITDETEFNEVFFDDVVRPRRPARSARATRAGGSRTRRSRTSAASTRASSSSTCSCSRSCCGSRSSTGAFDDHRLAPAARAGRRRGAAVPAPQLAHALARRRRARHPGPEGSALKLYWSEMSKRLHDTVMAVLGPAAPLWRGADDNPGDGAWQRSWLYYQASSIWAGTNEIQRNIIGERVLGLPREPKPDRDRRRPTVTGPLDGLRVLDLGTRIAAPFCAGLLGEQGAEVIKIEQPGSGDFMREIGPFADRRRRRRLLAVLGGRGTRPQERHARPAHARGPGPLPPARGDRRRGGRELPARHARAVAHRARRPRPERLVIVRISSFGQDGPYSHRPGLDRVGIGYGGLLHLTGYPDRPPVRVGVTISDYLTGVFAAQAATGRALRARRARRHGRGDRRRALRRGAAHPRVDARRATTSSASCAAARATGSRTRRRSTTTRPPTASTSASSPAPTPTSRGSARRWTGPTSLDDPRFARLADRAAHGDEINGIVADVDARRSPRAEIEERCVAHDVPVATAYTAADIFADPHIAARGDLVTVDDPVVGPLRQQAPFPRTVGEPVGRADGRAPARRAHREVLRRRRRRATTSSTRWPPRGVV